MMNKKGQEEMVGFAIILVIISVIFLLVLGFSLRKTNEVVLESYEVESFIGAGLQYTTDCEDYSEFLDIQDLIVSCNNEEYCLDGRNACSVLNSTLKDLIVNSWDIKKGSSIKGYKMELKTKEKDILSFLEGNETSNSKGDFQEFARKNEEYLVYLTLYS